VRPIFKFTMAIFVALISADSFAQLVPHVATAEQKIQIARRIVNERAQAQGLTLIDGTIDIYSGGDLLAMIKILPDAANSIASRTVTQAYDDEYVTFLVTNQAGEKFSGYIYLMTQREASFNTPSELTTNPAAGNKFTVIVTRRRAGYGPDPDANGLNLSKIK
jgi:hypothetical protein